MSGATAPPAAGGRGKETAGFAVWVILAYLCVEYGRPQFYVPALGYLKIGLWLVVAGLGILFFAAKHPVPREGKAVLLFLFLMFVAVPFSDSPRVTLDVTQTMAQMMVSGPLLMMVAVDSVRRLRLVLWAYMLLGSIQCFQGILHGGRGIGGYFVDENDLAMLGATVIPIAYFLVSTGKNTLARGVGFVGFVVCILGSVVSFSRGGFLALLAVAFYVVLRSRHRFATIVAIAVAVAVIFPFIPAQWYSEMESIKTSTESGDTGEMRLYMWGVAWRVFLSHPLMGVGPANFGRVAQSYQDRQAAAKRGLYLWGFACHSLYFTMLAEMGILGMTTFAVLLWFVFSATMGTSRVLRKWIESDDAGRDPSDLQDAKRLFGACRGLEGGMIGYLVAATFLTANYYPIFWSLVGMMAATRLVLTSDPALARLRAAPDSPRPPQFAGRSGGR